MSKESEYYNIMALSSESFDFHLYSLLATSMASLPLLAAVLKIRLVYEESFS